MSEQIQIDKELFYDCVKIICAGIDSRDVWDRAATGLYDKLEKIVNRQLYTQYKTAETAEEREQARLKYLDSVGIPKDFRWSKK